MSNKIKKDWKKVKESNSFHDSPDLDALMDEEGDEPTAGEAHGALDHPSYTGLEEKLTLAEQQAHENWEKSVRAIAELDNVRRRAERDITNAHRYGVEKLVTALLPVMDSLEQALQLASQLDTPSMHEGLDLTMKLMLDVLKKQGVELVDPIGLLFDPTVHEAMAMQPADAAPNTILTVFQKGYKLNDRVIRPARVVIAKSA